LGRLLPRSGFFSPGLRPGAWRIVAGQRNGTRVQFSITFASRAFRGSHVRSGVRPRAQSGRNFIMSKKPRLKDRLRAHRGQAGNLQSHSRSQSAERGRTRAPTLLKPAGRICGGRVFDATPPPGRQTATRRIFSAALGGGSPAHRRHQRRPPPPPPPSRISAGCLIELDGDRAVVTFISADPDCRTRKRRTGVELVGINGTSKASHSRVRRQPWDLASTTKGWRKNQSAAPAASSGDGSEARARQLRARGPSRVSPAGIIREGTHMTENQVSTREGARQGRWGSIRTWRGGG